jgi:hypothetical protein
MIDKTTLEELALASALPFLGEIAREIGMAKPLGEYTREEAITMIEVVVSAYQKYCFEKLPAQPQAFATHIYTQPQSQQKEYF